MTLQAPHTVSDADLREILEQLAVASHNFNREVVAVALVKAGRVLCRVQIGISPKDFESWMANEVDPKDAATFRFAMESFRNTCPGEYENMIIGGSAQ